MKGSVLICNENTGDTMSPDEEKKERKKYVRIKCPNCGKSFIKNTEEM